MSKNGKKVGESLFRVPPYNCMMPINLSHGPRNQFVSMVPFFL